MARGIKPRKKRQYSSMFDPYREQIEKCLDDGLTLQQTLDELGSGYLLTTLYTYVRKNNLRGGAWKREIETRRVCDKCEYCKTIRNQRGEYSVSNRLCTKSWQIINCSVVHCPRWCELEGEEQQSE